MAPGCFRPKRNGSIEKHKAARLLCFKKIETRRETMGEKYGPFYSVKNFYQLVCGGLMPNSSMYLFGPPPLWQKRMRVAQKGKT